MASERVSHAAPTETILHNFAGADGVGPAGQLVFDAAGNLYGTTRRGGIVNASCPVVNGASDDSSAGGCGVVFKLTPGGGGAWTQTVIFRFAGANGAYPVGPLIIDKGGNLYGTTSTGGNAARCPGKPAQGVAPGCGVAFMLSPPAGGGTAWTQTVLHRFTFRDGANPVAGVTMDAFGNLFGTAARGGFPRSKCFGDSSNGIPAGCGTVFELTPPAAGGTAWTSAVETYFGLVGTYPLGRILVKDGKLYGTTSGGGTATCPGDSVQGLPKGCGTVFSIGRPDQFNQRQYTTLFRFKGAPRAAYPFAGLVFDKSGNLYGTSYSGGRAGGAGSGTVFKLSSNGPNVQWTETDLHHFGVGADGANPKSDLLITATGALYGTTTAGGAQSNGIVFRLTPPAAGKTGWPETIFHNFDGSLNPDGIDPQAGLIRDAAGNLYGTTVSGATGTPGSLTSSYGAVFQVAP